MKVKELLSGEVFAKLDGIKDGSKNIVKIENPKTEEEWREVLRKAVFIDNDEELIQGIIEGKYSASLFDDIFKRFLYLSNEAAVIFIDATAEKKIDEIYLKQYVEYGRFSIENNYYLLGKADKKEISGGVILLWAISMSDDAPIRPEIKTVIRRLVSEDKIDREILRVIL